jgi:GTP-binding protein EngB required for normal cell division
VRPLPTVPYALPQGPPALPISPQRPPTQPERSPSVTDINVLLLGETGVGKSTFINAFVNYLVFNTLQQAEQDKPVVLIPVSFLITTGDQFDEFMVELGDADTNENHKHQGQSVTQQCKSYLFHLNDALRLRLIDTPGMGDTRGVDQDVKNIDHILNYVNSLSHLNAVCLLLKPNASRLDIFFRSCINQLLTYLTPIGYNNIIFCFTNARSTFFAPGNTGPLLRQMLKQEYRDDISFQKTNTFCFDSESFRYLAARKCGIEFDDFQKQECINSWTTSVTESIRLLNFIQTRKPYYSDEWQSPRKVALEITLLARPLMETLRLMLYNWKLREVGLIDKLMILKSNPVTTEICSNCAQFSIVSVGSFWLVEYESTKSTADKQCLCPSNERHFVIEATVKHEFVAQPNNLSIDELQSYFNDLLFKCDRLTHFLRQKDLLEQDDPFTPILKRFLDEERHICSISSINSNMNKRTQQVLHSISDLREQNSKRLSGSQEKLSLTEVYQIINELKSIHTVNQQTECIKTSRLLKMESNEHRVEIPFIENRSCSGPKSSFK